MVNFCFVPEFLTDFCNQLKKQPKRCLLKDKTLLATLGLYVLGFKIKSKP